MVTAIRDLQYLPINQVFDSIISTEIDGNDVCLTVGVVTGSSPNDERDDIKKNIFKLNTLEIRHIVNCEPELGVVDITRARRCSIPVQARRHPKPFRGMHI
jgi:hypothetical protein